MPEIIFKNGIILNLAGPGLNMSYEIWILIGNFQPGAAQL